MPSQRYKNPQAHCERAQELRKQATQPERLLWNALLSMKEETGLKFRRQHPLYPYIADFACIKARLIIELDGPSHDTRLAYDAKRDATLQKMGWTILRFDNDDVVFNLENVVLAIFKKCKELQE